MSEETRGGKKVDIHKINKLEGKDEQEEEWKSMAAGFPC